MTSAGEKSNDETSVGKPPQGSDDAEFLLIVSSGYGVSTSRVARGAELIVGRDAHSTLRIDDPSVSRRHARLSVGRQVRVQDLGSSNGTLVGGVRIEPGEPVDVRPGVVIAFGHVTVIVQEALGTDQSRRRAGDTMVPAGESPRPPRSPDGPIVLAPEMRRIYELVERIGPSPISVLLLGETGVGKEVLASEIHRRSLVANGPFVQLNCAALPESTLESELFGYERGAFTGAVKTKLGLIETAHGGTLFLDEIGEMALPSQAKLLRFLESGEVFRLGGLRPNKVEVRTISATNRDLRRCVDEGTFRADLFFRLNGVSLRIPPLRERRMEIPALAELMVERAARRHNRPGLTLSPGALAKLQQYDWPGNIRELRNTLERAVILCDGLEIGEDRLEDSELQAAMSPAFPPASSNAITKTSARTMPTSEVPGSSGQTPPPEESESLGSQVAALERKRVIDALERNDGNQSAAARQLGIARSTLIRRMERFNLFRK